MKTTIQHFENRAGGKGWIHIEHLLDSDALGSHVKMYARVTIDPHASIGVHLHQGDGESYLIEKGTALYHADGVTRTLHPGDHTWTPNGHRHGIENPGEEEQMCIRDRNTHDHINQERCRPKRGPDTDPHPGSQRGQGSGNSGV